MRVGRVAGAAGVLLVTGRADEDGVLHRALAGGVEGTHVEDVDTLHLAENLETLETGGLLEVGRDGADLGAGSEEVFLSLDLCRRKRKKIVSFRISMPMTQFVSSSSIDSIRRDVGAASRFGCCRTRFRQVSRSDSIHPR